MFRLSVGRMLYAKPHEASLVGPRMLCERVELPLTQCVSLFSWCSSKPMCENIDLKYLTLVKGERAKHPSPNSALGAGAKVISGLSVESVRNVKGASISQIITGFMGGMIQISI